MISLRVLVPVAAGEDQVPSHTHSLGTAGEDRVLMPGRIESPPHSLGTVADMQLSNLKVLNFPTFGASTFSACVYL